MASLDQLGASGPSGFGCARMPVDVSMGHGCWPPTNPIMGSVSTFTDQFAQVRVTDMWAPHCCPGPPGCHAVVSAVGSTTTFADQLPKMRMFDGLSCGDSVAITSLTTFAG